MKKNFFVLSLTIILVTISTGALAQYDKPGTTNRNVPKWLSAIGYWEVESNIHNPTHHILYCYNNENVLVYKETIDGLVLNIKKRKTKMRLKKLVDQTVASYAQQPKFAENQMLAIKLMKK